MKGSLKQYEKRVRNNLSNFFALGDQWIRYFHCKYFTHSCSWKYYWNAFIIDFLLTGIIQLKWVDIGASLLNRHLSFFFIPISVGLMTLGSIFMSSGIRLLFILVLSAIIGIIGTGLTSQLLAKTRGVFKWAALSQCIVWWLLSLFIFYYSNIQKYPLHLLHLSF